MALLDSPLPVGDEHLEVAGALGVASTRSAGRTSAALMRDAEIALRIAKDRAGPGWQVFRPEMQTAALDQMSLELEVVAEGIGTTAQPHVGPRRPPRTGEVTPGRLGGLLESLVDEAVDVRPGGRLVVLAEIAGLESVYLTGIDWHAQRQAVLVAYRPGTVGLENGLEVPWSETVCREALLRDIPDLTDVGHPDAMEGAAGFGIRSYLGVPVTTRSGAVFGTLCGASREPVEVPSEVVETFRAMARLMPSTTDHRVSSGGGARQQPRKSRMLLVA